MTAAPPQSGNSTTAVPHDQPGGIRAPASARPVRQLRLRPVMPGAKRGGRVRPVDAVSASGVIAALAG